MALISLDDFQIAAKDRLSKELYEYVASGSDDEQTLAENRNAFKRIFIRPRMMRNLASLDMSLTIFGQKVSMPIFASPAGVHQLMHRDGELATARAFAKAGSLMAVSQHATYSLEDIADAAPGAPRWFQSYILKHRQLSAELIKRAEKAGYSAIILTVDSVRFGFREADARNGFKGMPEGYTLANYPTQDGYGDRAKDAWDQNTEALFDDTVTWADGIAFIRSVTQLPIIAKGVMIPEEALEALNAGVDGIYVSNHGGRQLDGCLSTIESLEPIVQAVRSHSRRPDAPIFLDSGVRRGTDVFKALALGTSAVFIGRPVFFGLAVAGEEGVAKVLETIRSEFEATMALCGCKSLEAIEASYVAHKTGQFVYCRARL